MATERSSQERKETGRRVDSIVLCNVPVPDGDKRDRRGMERRLQVVIVDGGFVFMIISLDNSVYHGGLDQRIGRRKVTRQDERHTSGRVIEAAIPEMQKK